MRKRTKLRDRVLPVYSRGEEMMNMITHIVGAGFGAAALLLCLLRSSNSWSLAASGIYGLSLVTLYTVSSVYHGMAPGMGKKVMQVIDHCTIYFLISGSYTAVVLGAFRREYPAIAWGLFGFVWILAVVAVTLTAIDLKKYSLFSMICYVGMGWCVIPFWRQILQVLTRPGFLLLLLGGVAYTIGAVLYGLGKRRKWMHSVFHIFVVIGSVLQFLSVWRYGL